MFCKNCGTKMEENVNECTQCGAKVVTSDDGFVQTEVAKKEKKINLKYLILALAAMWVIIIVAIIIAIQPSKYNIEKYVTIDYSGYDGYGKAYVRLDKTALYKDINKGKDSEDNLSVENIKKEITYEAAMQSIKLDLVTESENLSNGDEIKVEITYDNELAKKAKMKFTGKTIKKKVEGLSEIQKKDIFKDLEVTFTGISPNGKIQYIYDNNNTEFANYLFSINKTKGLKNGDEVIFKVDVSDEEFIQWGFLPIEKEKKYIVSGLNESVQSYGELTDDVLKTLKSESEDIIYAYIAKSYSQSSSLADLKLVGHIFNTNKNLDDDSDIFNKFYLIYSGIVSNSQNEFRSSEVFFPVSFTNLLKGDNGISYEENNGIVGESYLDGTRYTTLGYTNPYVCYSKLVVGNRDNYTTSPGGGFEVYDEFEPILELSDIDDKFKEMLTKEATDKVISYLTEKKYSTNDLKSIGEYLLISKSNGKSFVNNNIYYIVISAEIQREGDYEPMRCYFPVKYSGIIKLPNGEYMIASSGGIVGRTNYHSILYSLSGFSSGKTMFTELVTAERENYTYMLSDGLKQFGE